MFELVALEVESEFEFEVESKFEPEFWFRFEFEPRFEFESEPEFKSEFEPVAFKEIEPAELMFDAKFVVLSVIEVPPFLLLPQLVSVRFLSCKVAILILPPAVIERFPEVEPESEIKFEAEFELEFRFEPESEIKFKSEFELEARFEPESEIKFEAEDEAEFKAEVGFNSVKSAFLDVEILAAKLVKSLAALIEIEPPLIEAFCKSVEEILPLLVAVEFKAS